MQPDPHPLLIHPGHQPPREFGSQSGAVVAGPDQTDLDDVLEGPTKLLGTPVREGIDHGCFG
jgi:hypothetical protein